MIRNSFLNPYIKKKETNEHIIKDDPKFLVNNMRPLTEKKIRNIPDNKEWNFIDHVLFYKPVAKLLYSGSADKEIEKLKSIKNPFEIKSKSQKKVMNYKITPAKAQGIEYKRNYIKKTISDYQQKLIEEKYQKEAKDQSLSKELGNKTGKNFMRERNQSCDNFKPKTQLEMCINEFYRPLNNQREKNFNRVLNNCMEKELIDKIKEAEIEKEKEIKRKIREAQRERERRLNGRLYKAASTPRMFHFASIEKPSEMYKPGPTPEQVVKMIPDVKLKIEDVYSRLYHNEVFLEHLESTTKKKRGNNKRRPTISLNDEERQEKLRRQKIFNKNNLKIKNILSSGCGKEFTLKITPDLYFKCLTKSSGGPMTNIDQEFLNKIKLENSPASEKLVKMTTLLDEAENNVLHRAVYAGYPEFVQYFVEKGVNVNWQNVDGDTPLHLAMDLDNLKIIEILLNKGADLSIKNSSGKTPYDYASDEAKSKFYLENRMAYKSTENAK